jgi:hypothetical protein
MDLGSPQLRAFCRVGHERQRSEGRHDCDPPKRRMSAVDDKSLLRSNGAMRSTRFPSACADLPQCLQSDVEGEAAVWQYRSRHHRHPPPNLPLLCYCLRGRPSPAHSRRSDQRFRRNAPLAVQLLGHSCGETVPYPTQLLPRSLRRSTTCSRTARNFRISVQTISIAAPRT